MNSKEVEKSLPLKGATEINETENAGSGTEIPLKPSAAGARQSRKNHTDQTDVQQEYLMPRKVSDHTRGNRTKSEVKHSAALEEEMQEGEKSDRSDIIYLKDDIKVPLQTSAIKENQDTKAIQELDTTKKTRTPSHSSVKKDVPSGKKGFVKIEPKKAEDIHVTGNNKVKVAVPIVETGKETEADMPAAARQNTLHHISHVEESPHTTESDDERTTMATSLTSATQDSGIRPRPKTAAEKKYKVTSATNRAKTAEAIESPVLETLETVTDKTEIRVVVPEFSAVPKGHQKAKPKSTKSPKVDETYNQTPIETAPGIVKDISKSLYIIEDGHFAKLGKVSIPNAEALRNTISVEREPLATSLSSSQAISPFHEHPKEVGHREQEIVSDAPTAGVQIPEITSQLKVKGKDHSAEPQPVKYYKSKKGPSSKKVDIRYGGKKRTAVLKDNPLEVEAIQNVAASLNPKVDVAQKEGASLTNSQNEYVQSGTNKEEEDMACFPGGSTFESIISPVELPRLSTSAQNQHAAHVSAPIKTDVTTPTKSILKRGPSLSSRPSTARITIKEDTYFNDDAIMSYRPQGPVVDVEKHTEFDIKTKTGALGKKAITLVVETPIKKIMVDSSTEMGDMAPSVTQPPPITLG